MLLSTCYSYVDSKGSWKQVSRNCNCCFSKIGFSYYKVKKDENKSSELRFIMCIFWLPTMQGESIFNSMHQEVQHCVLWDPMMWEEGILVNGCSGNLTE
jgi:hypothetical protein